MDCFMASLQGDDAADEPLGPASSVPKTVPPTEADTEEEEVKEEEVKEEVKEEEVKEEAVKSGSSGDAAADGTVVADGDDEYFVHDGTRIKLSGKWGKMEVRHASDLTPDAFYNEYVVKGKGSTPVHSFESFIHFTQSFNARSHSCHSRHSCSHE